MAQKPYRRGDEPRPGSGFRLVLPDGRVRYLAPDEKAGAAQVALAQQAVGASPQEISDAVIEWLELRRQSKKFIQGDE